MRQPRLKPIPLVLLAAVLLSGAAPALAQGSDLFAGIEAYKRSEYTEAEVILTGLDYREMSDPEQVLAWKYLGATQLAIGQPEAAKESFIRLQGIDPAYTLDPALFAPHVVSTFKDARMTHARRLLEEGLEAYRAKLYEVAIEKFERVLLLDPDSGTADDYLTLARYEADEENRKTDEDESDEDEKESQEEESAPGPEPSPAPPIESPPYYVYVPGTACVQLAGEDRGATVGGDRVPANSPIAVNVGGARTVKLSASGTAKYSRRGKGQGPAGKGDRLFTNTEYEQFGISSAWAPVGSLVGVFTGSGEHFGAPARLAEDSRQPVLRQAFLIGAGPRIFDVPEGAKTLHLGVHDGADWTNNSGGFSVSVVLGR